MDLPLESRTPYAEAMRFLGWTLRVCHWERPEELEKLTASWRRD